MCAVSNRAASSSGFTLIEVLIALTILAVGMLGSLSLLIEGLRASRGAMLETQAAVLAADLGDRIRANRAGAAAYALNEDTVLDAPPQTCTAIGECDPSDVAALDLYEWQRQVRVSVPDASASVLVAPVTGTAAHLVTITVGWTQTGASVRSSFALTVQA